ncbi:hypothetical protein MG293_001038 [Ovis ammon polii]|uniref:Uncharacterized protein n=1 Tax=Ovis ammon polii TaxID=230172 RepID=A0AAD4ULU3_OVIAM|nr:hypothetical protein MG293_001038 [Ovis ammon polii]
MTSCGPVDRKEHDLATEQQHDILAFRFLVLTLVKRCDLVVHAFICNGLHLLTPNFHSITPPILGPGLTLGNHKSVLYVFMEAMKSEIFERFIIFLSVSYKYLMGNILEYGCIAMREEYNINLIFITREPLLAANKGIIGLLKRHLYKYIGMA